MASVLFVCLGNICRSPAAEVIFREHVKRSILADSTHIESCGIGDWHIGSLPDERMRNAAKGRGYILANRAQLFKPEFFMRFDYILVADKKVLHELYSFAKTPEHKAKIHLITHFSPTYPDHDIPDPYYEGEAGFEHVLNMIEDASQGLLLHLQNKISKK